MYSIDFHLYMRGSRLDDVHGSMTMCVLYVVSAGLASLADEVQ